MNTAVSVLSLGGDLRAVTLGAALASLAALGGDGRVGAQLLGVFGSRRRGRGGGGASSGERAQLGMLVGAAVLHPIGLERLYVGDVCVMGTVRVGGVCVCLALRSIAYLAAGLRPAGLGVVDRSGSGYWLRCDTLVGCCEHRVREAAVVIATASIVT